MIKICDACIKEFECNLTPEQLQDQYEESIVIGLNIGLEPGDGFVELCDNCYSIWLEKPFYTKKRV